MSKQVRQGSMVALGSAVLMGTTVRIRMDNYISKDMRLLLLNTWDGLPISVLSSFAFGSLKDPNVVLSCVQLHQPVVFE